MSEQEVAVRRGRDGGRWINQRPTEDELAEWFTTAVKIDPALKREEYLGGIVVIPAVDNKAKYIVGFTDRGIPVLDEGPELSYNPYPKVDARIAYYWDLLAVHPEWVGEIEHVPSSRLDVEPALGKLTETTDENGHVTRVKEFARPGGLATMVHQLPTGFSVMSVPVGEGYSHFLCATVRVSIFQRGENGEKQGLPLRTGRGTKQVPLTKGYRNSPPFADDSSLMKAETGAFGRALGFAGIFVISGAGVATAEDMMEAMAQGESPPQQPQAITEPQTPEVKPARTGAEQAAADTATLKERALLLYKQLQDEHPGRVEEFTTWAHQRNLKSLNEAEGPTLRGVVSKLEKLLDAAEQATAQPPPASEASNAEPG